MNRTTNDLGGALALAAISVLIVVVLGLWGAAGLAHLTGVPVAAAQKWC